jgi:hydrogenase maturation protease
VSGPAPVLVLTVGNPSRGDDAIGPELASRLETARLPGVEVLAEFQLQVENALDLAGRSRVIVIDAGVGTIAPIELSRVRPAPALTHTSHAVSPGALLSTYERVSVQAAPELWLLSVRGESFELGASLSAAARRRAERAWQMLPALCRVDLPVVEVALTD